MWFCNALKPVLKLTQEVENSKGNEKAGDCLLKYKKILFWFDLLSFSSIVAALAS